MATMTVTGPDGRRARVTIPDGADETTVQAKLNQLKSNWGTATQAAPKPQAPAAMPSAVPTMGADDIAADAAKSFGIGLAQGGIGLATTPGNLEYLGRAGIDAAARGLGYEDPQLSSNTFLPTYNDAKGTVEKYTGEFYKPKSVVGEYARTVGEFAPMAALGGGGAIARAANVVAPAVVSETAGQLTKGTEYEPWARAAGALSGGFLPNAAMRTVTPNVNQTARQAQVRLLEKEGVSALTAGQKTGSKPLRWAESVTQDTPFGGGRAAQIANDQAEQFTAAALRRAGVQDANRATPEVIDGAFKNLGSKFDQLAAQNPLKADNTLIQRLRRVQTEYDELVPPSQRAPVMGALMDDIKNLARPGEMVSGDVYHATRSRIDRLSRAAKSDPQLSNALRGWREALDDAMERGIPPANRGQWREARTQYRHLLSIEKAVNGAGEAAATGLVSPSQLRNAVRTQNSRLYARGKDELGNLARAGEAIMKPLPQSGTAPRAAAQHAFTMIGGIGGNSVAGLPGALAGVAMPAMTARTLMSKPVQNWLSNQAMAGPIEAYAGTRLNALQRLPQALMEADQDQVLRGGIGPSYDEYGNRLY